LGEYEITGYLYDSNTKAPLGGVKVIVTSKNSEDKTVTAESQSNGKYSVVLPNKNYVDVLLVKEGYFDINGTVVNTGGLQKLNFNFALRPGFGKEDVQIITLAKRLSPHHQDRFITYSF
jgi:hypothetical protein